MKLATSNATPAARPSRTPRSPRNPSAPRVPGTDARSRAARTPRSQPFDDRSSSVLDETRRRMKSNMRAITALLRLELGGFQSGHTEAFLARMEDQLQSMALHYRSRCRGGDFEPIDLAVFLRHASRLLNSPPQFSLNGGWVAENDGTLAWHHAPDPGPHHVAHDQEKPLADILGDLESVIPSLPDSLQDRARLAVYACAVIAPPWLFHWRRHATGGRQEGDVSVRLQAQGELVVQLVFSERGPGLPRFFELSTQVELARALTSVLDRLIEGDSETVTGPAVRFDVAFAKMSDSPGQSVPILGHAA